MGLVGIGAYPALSSPGIKRQDILDIFIIKSERDSFIRMTFNPSSFKEEINYKNDNGKNEHNSTRINNEMYASISIRKILRNGWRH